MSERWLMRGVLLGMVVCGRPAEAQTIAPELGPYGRLETYCGPGAIPKDVATLPWIGCFALTAGHSATGSFVGHRVDLTVDAGGQEAFTIDGTALEERVGATRTPSGTNFPFIRRGAVGYSICLDNSFAACPSEITVFSRYPDRSVLFTSVECIAPTYQACVLTQANWDYEQSRRK